MEAINNNKSLPKIIEVRDKIRVLLAQKVGREMNYDFIIKGTGDEYQRLNEIKKNKLFLNLEMKTIYGFSYLEDRMKHEGVI